MPYLKVLGNCVVAAAGFSGDPTRAARTIAQAALALRDAGASSARGLRMGIDTGVAMGSPVGREHHCYNIWGAAVRRAAEMAQSAPPGGIQVTAFAYRHLVGQCLFRPRGGFYVHPEGETVTYLLAGRL
jgi:adenylate cyclase